VLYSHSKSDVSRLAEIRRFTGLDKGEDVGMQLLDLTNRIWRSNTISSRFITDSMVAIWLEHDDLHTDIPDILTEPGQYRLLAWYCCARPLNSGCRLSREPVDPIVDRMGREVVAESPNSQLPYTALMMSIYHFRPDVHDAVSFRGEGRHPSFLGWYYSHGIRELGIIHHVSAEERAVLNTRCDNLEYDIVSPLCLFALDWLPHPDFDLTSRADRARAWAWFTECARQTEPFAALSPGREAGWGEADRQSAAPANIALAPGASVSLSEPCAIADLGAKYHVECLVAEYFDRRGAGSRLLLSGEWFPEGEACCWSHAPWASLIFQLLGPIEDVVNIGLLFEPASDRTFLPIRLLTIYLNGTALWSGLARDAAGRELILRVSGQNIRSGAHNLLQFHVPEPFAGSDLMASHGTGRLGVALRRLWIGQEGAGSSDAGHVAAWQPRASIPARANRGDEKLVVLRGDLLSHTGYGKATRALARLVPEQYRTIGVDIHPDPSDNQAAAPFPIVPEAEALQQVLDRASRCVVLHCTAPDDFAVWPNARNVGWFFWETDTIPYLREWPFRLGLMDAIWAPTTFVAGFVRGAGYRGPIHSVPWPDEFTVARDRMADSAKGLSTSYFAEIADLPRPHRLRMLSDLRSEAQLLFLAVQSLAPRKGLPLLLSEWRSHVEGSGGSDILVLRLAFRHASGLSANWEEVFLEALATAGFRRGAPVRIALIPAAVSETALTGMYRTADGFLSMSYGEGFGGPIFEAMQNDCPVIAPRHTGLCDLIPENYPLTIASRRMAVALKGNLAAYPYPASWHIPQAGDMRAKIEQFAAMAPPMRRGLAQECRKHAMSFCWTPVVRQQLAAALDDLDLEGLRSAGAPVSSRFATAPLGRHAAD
jgi:glycosyltransferase involved in cell wall biosynthesis